MPEKLLCPYVGGNHDPATCEVCAEIVATNEDVPAGDGSLDPLDGRTKRESDYNAALQRYYDTGTVDDHEACLRAFGLWIIAVREESSPIGRTEPPFSAQQNMEGKPQ